MDRLACNYNLNCSIVTYRVGVTEERRKSADERTENTVPPCLEQVATEKAWRSNMRPLSLSLND